MKFLFDTFPSQKKSIKKFLLRVINALCKTRQQRNKCCSLLFIKKKYLLKKNSTKKVKHRCECRYLHKEYRNRKNLKNFPFKQICLNIIVKNSKFYMKKKITLKEINIDDFIGASSLI